MDGRRPPGSGPTPLPRPPIRRRLHDAEVWAKEHPYRFVAVLFLTAKLVVLLAAYYLLGFPDGYLTSLSLKWDGIHYLRIARYGYGLNTIPELQNPLAFAPVFPFLIKLTGAFDLSPLLVNNACGIAATLVVTRLMGLRAGTFFALFPTWLAYSSFGYSEGAFVLLAAAALLLFRERHFEWASVLTGFAVATRYTGALSFATLLVPAFQAGRRSFLNFLLPGLSVGLVVLALFKLQGGSFFAYLTAQDSWEAAFVLPHQQARWLLDDDWTNTFPEARGLHPSFWLLRNYCFALVGILGFVRLWRRDHDTTLATYSIVVILLSFCLIGFPAISVPRILLMAFPALAACGRFIDDRAIWGAYAAGGIVGGAFIITFQLGGSFFG